MAIWRPWVLCGMWIPAAASHRKHCTAYCACWGVTDLDAKTEAALRAAERCPFVLLHINGADEAAHRHDSAEKETFLRRVDGRVFSRLLASEHEIMVASDHGADPESGAHLGGPQPFFTSR